MALNKRSNYIDVDEVYTDEVMANLPEEKPVVVKQEPLSEPEDEVRLRLNLYKARLSFRKQRLRQPE